MSEKESCFKKILLSLIKKSIGFFTIILVTLGFVFLYFGLHEWYFPIDKSNVDLLTAFGSSFIAATLLYTIWLNQIELDNKKSKRFFEIYLDFFNIILKRLNSDVASRRTSWITAASLAKQILEVDRNVTNKEDRKILNAYQRNLAHDISELFKSKRQNYFCGVDESSVSAKDFFNSLKKRPVTSNSSIWKFDALTYLDMDTIKSIFDVVNLIWKNENEVSYRNDIEFINIIKFNYEELYLYLNALKEYSEGKIKDNKR